MGLCCFYIIELSRNLVSLRARFDINMRSCRFSVIIYEEGQEGFLDFFASAESLAH